MEKQKFIRSTIAAVFVVLLCFGCGGGSQIKQSGFMEDYPQFKPGKDESAQVYIKEGTDFKPYTKIMMDEVVFFHDDSAEYKGISPAEMKDLSEAWHRAMVEAFKDGYTFTDQPGPDVLRIRTALTEINASKPGRNVVSTVMPVGLAVSVAKKAATGSYTGVGGATMEMEALDSVSNERLAAGIDSRSGSRHSGMTKYGAVEEAFQYWARRLRERLDEMRGMAKKD